MRTRRSSLGAVLVGTGVLALAGLAGAWTPKPVANDPLVRMPGSQTNQGITLDAASTCSNCHAGFATAPEDRWRGSMMAQAARDPLFWAALTVAAQDSIWALGNPNAADLCIRCHSPGGWLGGRSDPPNGSALSGADFDGVTCEACHKMVDPFFEDTYAGVREGSDWAGYWDESNQSSTPSAPAALTTRNADRTVTSALRYFNGANLYGNDFKPKSSAWTEHGGGQYVVAGTNPRRGNFADANANHSQLYSRHHRSRYFCASCHDVSNPVLVNLPHASQQPGVGTNVLPSEQQPAFSYGHIERTFSELMLSDFGVGQGAPGSGPWAPEVFDTSQPGNLIASCQDCHMADTSGKGCNKAGGVNRPSESVEHPNTGQPTHDLVGGNAWIPWILASTVPSSPNYDAINATLLGQGPQVLTLNLQAGLPLDPVSLLDASNRAVLMLQRAASVSQVAYQAANGNLSFRVQNLTGHKLPSGYPEGRRLFVNVRVYKNGALVHEVNPYDELASTLRGLSSPTSPALGTGQVRNDGLVYEVKAASSLTGESETFHMALATSRTKDNRIPPRGFRVNEAAARLSEPVANGVSAPGLYTAAEYTGGWDDVNIAVPTGADGVEVRVYYQTTSREYIEFLRDEIDGTATTLSSPAPSGEAQAYVAQSDPFFSRLAAWGSTIEELWLHNRDVPGAAPVMVAMGSWGTVVNPCSVPGSDGDPCDDGLACTSGDACGGGSCMGQPVVCVAVDECHVAGICAPTTGLCSTPMAPDGTACTGGSCDGGVCVASGTGGGGAGGGGTGGGGAGAGTGGHGRHRHGRHRHGRRRHGRGRRRRGRGRRRHGRHRHGRRRHGRRGHGRRGHGRRRHGRRGHGRRRHGGTGGRGRHGRGRRRHGRRRRRHGRRRHGRGRRRHGRGRRILRRRRQGRRWLQLQRRRCSAYGSRLPARLAAALPGRLADRATPTLGNETFLRWTPAQTRAPVWRDFRRLRGGWTGEHRGKERMRIRSRGDAGRGGVSW
jgi:hypothetical protein